MQDKDQVIADLTSEICSLKEQLGIYQADTAARMKAMGMLSPEELLNPSGPMTRFLAHAGVQDLESFAHWLTRKTRETLLMRMGYETGKKPKDELYEWVFAKSAALQDVSENFHRATGGIYRDKEMDKT